MSSSRGVFSLRPPPAKAPSDSTNWNYRKARPAILAEHRAERDALRGKPWPADPAQVVAAWSAEVLRVPKTGKPLILPAYLVAFLADALAAGVLEAALTCGRKCGKSFGIAALILACLVGPLARPALKVLLASYTGKLAGVIVDAIEAIADASGLEDLAVTHFPPPGGARCDRLGTALQVIASDKGAAGHALEGDVLILDEAGMWGEDRRSMWNACLAALSAAQDGGKVLAIGTKYRGPMFRALLDAGLAGQDGYAAAEYAAPEGCSLDDVEAWKAANPTLGTIKSWAVMRQAAGRALANSQEAPDFMAQHLNLEVPVDQLEMIVTVAQWRTCEGEVERRGSYYLGVDLGQSVSMTAAFAYWPETGAGLALGAFPGQPSLAERGQVDEVGTAYTDAAAAGELVQLGSGQVTPVTPFLAFVIDRLGGELPAAIGCDRYRKKEAIDALASAAIRAPVEWRGQGAGWHGHEDVRAFQRAVLGGRLHVGPSVLMRQAILESRVKRDDNGNPSLAKARQKGRIDALQAAVIAVGLGTRREGLVDTGEGVARRERPATVTFIPAARRF
ncbi:MAG: hypothetical protein F4010_05330 [Cenarchaeum sp. SB0669_bin_11]|nr:hypothetical protein [Cenarchaeum sp. SB0669_bin_11]